MVFVIASSLTTLMVLKKQVDAGPLTAHNIVGVIFFSSCSIICIMFLRVAHNFKKLMVRWTDVELNFSSIDYQLPTKCWSLRKRLVITTVAYLTLSTFEHSLYLSTEIHKFLYDVNICKPKDIDMLEVFISRHLGFVVNNLPFKYNIYAGLFIEYLNFSYTFVWNFFDLFIILISIGIAFLFEKINSRVDNFKGLIVNENVWAEIRSHHVQVSELLQHVNDAMGSIFTFSCFVDGYFLLVQLLNITVWVEILKKKFSEISLLFVTVRYHFLSINYISGIRYYSSLWEQRWRVCLQQEFKEMLDIPSLYYEPFHQKVGMEKFKDFSIKSSQSRVLYPGRNSSSWIKDYYLDFWELW